MTGTWRPQPVAATCVDCGTVRILKFPYKVADRCRSCAMAASQGKRGHHPPHEFKCAICAKRFMESFFWVGKKKLCSKDCQNELYRRVRIGNGNPNYKHGKRVGGHLRGWSVTAKGETCCRVCGSSDGLDLHHAIPRGTWRAGRKDLRNGITLCRKCHSNWHNRKIDIPRSVFTDEEWAFISSADLIDRSTAAWLDRHYPVMA